MESRRRSIVHHVSPIEIFCLRDEVPLFVSDPIFREKGRNPSQEDWIALGTRFGRVILKRRQEDGQEILILRAPGLDFKKPEGVQK